MSKYDLLQWKFTACKYNIEESNGFNTFSMSEGLTAEDKADLCRMAGAYTPPDNLPYTPTAEEIAALFPVVFSSFPLQSGKRAVVRTSYVGRDYAGMRWGNFFSHALVLPSNSWPFYPIQLFDSELLKSGLTEEELQIETRPSPLPPITVEKDSLRDFSSEIPRFFAADSIRYSTLIQLLNALRSRNQTGKPLILRDAKANIPFWIAAIQYAFPVHLAGEISFTTYVHSLSYGERLLLTTFSEEDNTQNIDSPTTTATHFVFDLANKTVPSVPKSSNIFTKEIKENEPVYPGKDLIEIHGFTRQIQCSIDDNSLEKSVLCYKFLKWNIVPQGTGLIQSVFDFCFQQNAGVRLNLVKIILKKRHLFNAEVLESLFNHLMKIIAKSKNDATLVAGFIEFFIFQFQKDVKKLVYDECTENFKIIDSFMKEHSNIGQKIFERVKQLIDNPSEGQIGKKNVFLYFSLVLCLYANEGTEFTDYLKFLPGMDTGEIDALYEVILHLAIAKSFNATVHKQVITLYKSYHDGLSEDFIERYLNILNKANPLIPEKGYGMDQWKFGKPAEKQGTAFISYILNETSGDDFGTWTGFIKGTDYLKARTGYKIVKNRFWSVFDIESELSDKKKWEYNRNVRKMLEPLCKKKNISLLRSLGFPSQQDIWKAPIKILSIVCGVSVAIVTAIVLALVFCT